MSVCIADPTDLAVAPLWDRTRAMFARAVAALGGAARIAAISELTRKLRRSVIAWLSPLEHIVRKLLVAEAARLSAQGSAGFQPANKPAPPLRQHVLRGAALHRASHAGGKPALQSLDLSQPHTWPARFSLAPPRDERAVPESRAPHIRALWGETPKPQAARIAPHRSDEADTAFRLARRFEALRRVLDNPLPHAQRLARLIARLKRRFPEIVTRYLWAPARTGDFDAADPRLSIDALCASFEAAPAFSDSS